MAKKNQPSKPSKEKLSPERAAIRDQIFDALQELRVTNVTVEWSGGGDSGQVDSVVARDEKQDVEIDLTKDKVTVTKAVTESVDSGRKDKNGITTYFQVKKTVQETSNLEELIGSFTEDLWEHFGQGGWWNNDGGYGRMTIDVKNREMNFEHNNYRTESSLDAEGII